MPQRQRATQGQTTQWSDGHFTDAHVSARLLQWGKGMEEALPKENKASDPRGASTKAALLENKPHCVNKQKMNRVCQEAGIWGSLLSRHFMVTTEKQEVRIIHLHCTGTAGSCYVGQPLLKPVESATLSPGKGTCPFWILESSSNYWAGILNPYIASSGGGTSRSDEPWGGAPYLGLLPIWKRP